MIQITDATCKDPFRPRRSDIQPAAIAPRKLPPDMEALVPSEFTIHPTLSGVGVAEMVRIVSALLEKREPSAADVQAWLARVEALPGHVGMTT